MYFYVYMLISNTNNLNKPVSYVQDLDDKIEQKQRWHFQI